jgi:hypothetical protein
LQSTSTGYKLIKKIKDDRFDEDQIHQYDLLVQLGVKDMQMGIVDVSDSRLLYFEDYVFGDLNSHQELLDLYRSLFESHPLLPAGFWKSVKVSIKNQKFVQVPSSLFLKEAAADYLRFNAPVDLNQEDVCHCISEKGSLVTVFLVQKDQHAWLKSLYVNSKLFFIHQAGALIDGLIFFSGQDTVRRLHVFVDRFKLHLVSVDQGKLVYYNQFVIKHFSDYVKYIMLVLQGLDMDQQSTPIILWGYIGKNSPHYQEFVKYIRNVAFGDRPAFIKFGYIFDEMQEHHFYDLFSMCLSKPADA